VKKYLKIEHRLEKTGIRLSVIFSHNFNLSLLKILKQARMGHIGDLYLE